MADYSTTPRQTTLTLPWVASVFMALDLTTRPDGMRCHSATLSWWSLPKGPGGHTPVAIKNAPVTTFLPQAGVYELVLRYRSPGFVVDKIAFTRTPQAPVNSGQ